MNPNFLGFYGRPVGVTVITVLTVVSGTILLIAGIGFLIIGSIAELVTNFSGANNVASPGNLLTIIVNGTSIPITNPAFTVLGPIGLVIVGYVLVGIGIVSFIVSYGLFRGHGWAWTATWILSIIGITVGALTVASGDLVGAGIVIFEGIIIYYLYKPNIKSYFGKSQILTR